MRSLPGYVLDERIHAGRRSVVYLPQFLSIARQLAEGLEAIHRQNVIYKSITPHNIVIHSGTGLVKIIDFSFATPHALERRSSWRGGIPIRSTCW